LLIFRPIRPASAAPLRFHPTRWQRRVGRRDVRRRRGPRRPGGRLRRCGRQARAGGGWASVSGGM